MPYNPNYIPITNDEYDDLMGRYHKFINSIGTDDYVNVFLPLTPKQIEETNLIREISKELQTKKEEYIRKAQAAEEDAQTAAKDTEVGSKENIVNGTADTPNVV